MSGLGIGSAAVKVCLTCKCEVCGSEHLSSQTNTISIKPGPVEDLPGLITIAIASQFVQPPIGWAVYGRGHYKCSTCLT